MNSCCVISTDHRKIRLDLPRVWLLLSEFSLLVRPTSACPGYICMASRMIRNTNYILCGKEYTGHLKVHGESKLDYYRRKNAPLPVYELWSHGLVLTWQVPISSSSVRGEFTIRFEQEFHVLHPKEGVLQASLYTCSSQWLLRGRWDWNILYKSIMFL